MMRTLASFSRTLQYECFFAHELVEKDIAGSKRRKLEQSIPIIRRQSLWMLMQVRIKEKLKLSSEVLIYVWADMIPQTIPSLGLCRQHTKMTIIILTLRGQLLVVQDNHGMICIPKLMVQQHMTFSPILRSVG
ncbi:hypothetical protein GLYMA_19G034766v4 [Glycine max]|nr:hypothetical protein GLYMA_19G034766v4 [Glycine max]KAH1076259.1 hypothetical protein GYH30_051936 [Glycine max]